MSLENQRYRRMMKAHDMDMWARDIALHERSEEFLQRHNHPKLLELHRQRYDRFAEHYGAAFTKLYDRI